MQQHFSYACNYPLDGIMGRVQTNGGKLPISNDYHLRLSCDRPLDKAK